MSTAAREKGSLIRHQHEIERKSNQYRYELLLYTWRIADDGVLTWQKEDGVLATA
jgi:hypothetical protein